MTRENATASNCLRTQVWICQSLPWRTDWSFKHSIVECERINEHVYPFSALWLAYHLSPCRALRLSRAKCQHRAHGRPKVRSPWLGWKWWAVRWVSTFNYIVSIDELPGASSQFSRFSLRLCYVWALDPAPSVYCLCGSKLDGVSWKQTETNHNRDWRLTQTRFFLSPMAIANLHRSNTKLELVWFQAIRSEPKLRMSVILLYLTAFMRRRAHFLRTRQGIPDSWPFVF